ncbi:MAG: DUF4190 domain-containing protein [Acidimicrobiaceae bacterium]|nr:DUF4190 domain-containing protein [Acidimicrobiaceae bacterium]
MTTAAPGAPYQAGQYYAVGPQLKNGLGVAGMVCGIIGLVFGFIPLFGIFFAVPLGILGVVFGAVGLRRVSRQEANNRGVAIAGLVTGILALIVGFILFAAIYSATNQLHNDLNNISTNSSNFQQNQQRVDHDAHQLLDHSWIGNL